MDINLSNYSRNSWSVFETETPENEIVLHWANISGAGGSYVKFIRHSVFIEIFTFSGNSSYPDKPNIKYSIDNTSKKINEKIKLIDL